MTTTKALLLPRFSHEIQKFRERSLSLLLSKDEIERLRAIGYAEAREKGWPEGLIRHYLGQPGVPWVGEYEPPFARLRHAWETRLRESGSSESEIHETMADFDRHGSSDEENFHPPLRQGEMTYFPGGSGEPQSF
jgi:hypothetical protein